MTPPISPLPARPAHKDHTVTFVASAYLVAFAAWVFVGAGDATQRATIADSAFLPVSLVAAAMAWRSTRLSAKGSRASRGWRWIAMGFLCYSVGDILWFYFEVVRHIAPFPSAADAAYLGFYPCLTAGLLLLPARRSGAAWRMLGLDAAIVVLGGGMVVWYLVVEPTFAQGGQSGLAASLSVAYPVGDLLLLFSAAWVLLRRVDVANKGVWVLLAAVGLFVVSDVAYARQSLLGTYRSGSWTDAGWMSAQVLTIIAAIRHGRRGRSPGEPPARRRASGAAVSSLPYAAVAISYGLVVLVGGRDASRGLQGLLLGAGLMTLLVLARQVAASRENARLFDEVRRLAMTDQLTGLLTRRAFVEVASHALDEAARDGTPVSVVILDIDHFKGFNDSLGHAAGDAVLTSVARCCREEVRAGDAVARLGGDELVALLPGLSADAALAVAERFRAAVAASPLVTAAGPVAVTLSIGVATAFGRRDLDDLLAEADRALYQAKGAGRDRAQLSPPRPQDERRDETAAVASAPMPSHAVERFAAPSAVGLPGRRTRTLRRTRLAARNPDFAGDRGWGTTSLPRA